ncbi:MAG: hypothetical protein M1825_002884 [Sarcosagium campestre]|nr:MAG: hypothetical protein M1825_002884 [Sarcosagium campestre]
MATALLRTRDQWPSNTTAIRILTVTHFAYPIIVLVVFLFAFTLHSILNAKQTSKATPSAVRDGSSAKQQPRVPRGATKDKNDRKLGDFSPLSRAFFHILSIAIIITFVGNAINIIAHALKDRPWWCGQAAVIYVVASIFVYALILISLIDTSPSPTAAHQTTWSVGLLLEILLFAASLALYTSPHRERTALSSHGGRLRRRPSGWEIVELLLDVLRIVLIFGLVGLYTALTGIRRIRQRRVDQLTSSTEETQGLLEPAADGNGHASSAPGASSYGGVEHNGKPPEPVEAPVAGWSRPTTLPSKSWWEYIKGYMIFFPYLWPSKSRRLQLSVLVCIVIVLVQRVLNVLGPYQVGLVTNTLAGEDGQQPRLPWGGICLFILYRFLQGSNGVLGALRSMLWIPIEQYSYRELSVAAFEHVHGLSLDFHLGKRTGEVLSALSKGGAINTFLEQVTFQVGPMLIDLCVAIGYFLIAFDAYYALVVSIITVTYLYLTIRLAQWRTAMRREMANLSREEDAVMNDSMVSYETVKYFNAEAYEFKRYRDTVDKLQKAEFKVWISLSVLNVSQNLVFTLGLLVTCFIAAYQVTTGQRKVGKFVTLLTYMSQLQGPLNYFGSFYRSVQNQMINSERLLELFKEQPTVIDAEGAKDLVSCEGEIRFQDVQFSYDSRKAALQGLSFTCPPGTTTALVGESGGGKSTVFRLLFRFYNASDGSIQVDGHDVQDITIDSFRKNIGVVPQDTVLFNETLMYNLKYANPGVTDEEVFDACRAASVHDKILGFPDQYQTKVGERGLRLSGGEKQRVAIARSILKNPRIILLDEATAALDTETEQHIQTALRTLSKGRTMLVIAHRLSTIINADQILCLHAGRVVEAGTHDELLKLKGRYASMWKKQIRAERAAEEARVMTNKAEQLRRESATGDGSNEGSDNDGDGHRSGVLARSLQVDPKTGEQQTTQLSDEQS